jgi:hypothetical protein
LQVEEDLAKVGRGEGGEEGDAIRGGEGGGGGEEVEALKKAVEEERGKAVRLEEEVVALKVLMCC